MSYEAGFVHLSFLKACIAAILYLPYYFELLICLSFLFDLELLNVIDRVLIFKVWERAWNI